MSKLPRSLLLAAVLAALTGCERSADLTIRAINVSAAGETTGIGNLQVRLLPYDRDSIFDALTRRAERPEPAIPEELIELRDSVSELQSRWRQAEANWMDTYSQLQSLAEQMETMNTASSEYARAFRRFDDLEAQERRLDELKEDYFDRFTELQSRYNAIADSLRAVRMAWGDRAFAGFGEIRDSILEAKGREELWDTTGTRGWARFGGVPGGDWWVHSRFELPYEELYWNVPYDASGGAVDTLILSNENAELRPLF